MPWTACASSAPGFLLFAYGLVLTQAFNGAGRHLDADLDQLRVFLGVADSAGVVAGDRPGAGARAGVYVAITMAFSTLAVMSAFVFRRGGWKTKAV